MARPVDICSDHTAAFVRRFARPQGEILEIGGGDGQLAALLAAEDFVVTMIEADAALTEAAAATGVNAHCATWPAFDSPPVDCVLFSRSLHHIDDVDAALAEARRRLKPGGVLLVEDFDFPGADAPTAAFLMDRGHAAMRNFDLREKSFLASIATANEPVTVWNEDHDHHIHPFRALAAAAENAFGQSLTEKTAYLFRYVAAALPETESAHQFTLETMNAEVAAIDKRLIVPIGRRIVAAA